MHVPATPNQPDNRERLRQLLPVGDGGLMPMPKLGSPIKAGWVLRRTNAQIERFKGHPKCIDVQAGGCWQISLQSRVEVRVALMAIGFGLWPHGANEISVAFINEYDPLGLGLLENLTVQEWMPVVVIGDTEAYDCIARVKNSQRQWAQKTLAAVSSLPPWTAEDFDRAVTIFKRECPNKLALWERFTKPQS